MRRQNVCRPLSCFLFAILLSIPFMPAQAEPQGERLASLDVQMMETGIFGMASTYNPFAAPNGPEGFQTASGEFYDPDTWTAAIQIDLRDRFGGVRFGRNYQPVFALVECGDKKAIVRVNDVGPLAPGRIVDLSDRTMRYFDPSLALGLLSNVVITPLPGDGWTPGPLTDDPQIAAYDPPTGNDIIAGFNASGRLRANTWAVSEASEPRQRAADLRRRSENMRNARE